MKAKRSTISPSYQALSCINYRKYDGTGFVPAGGNAPSKKLVESKYFTANELLLTDPLRIWPDRYESFLLYCCIEGGAMITPSGTSEPTPLLRGEWVLIPAAMPDFVLSGITPGTRLMEVYVGKVEEKDNYINE